MPNKKKQRINVLLIGSNCKGKKETRIGKEIKKIRKILKNSLFHFIDAPAAKRNEIFEEISKVKPQILHFSGHGTFDTGPLFDEDEHFIKTIDLMEELIETLKKGKEYIKLIIFNVCESINIAKEVTKFIEFTIGTMKKTNDDCAIAFSKGFYQMLVNGDSIKNSFLNGKKQYNFKYTELKSKTKVVPFQIFPDSMENSGDFSETFGSFLSENWREDDKTHSDKQIDNEKMERTISQRWEEFESLVSKIQQRGNQFDMKLTIFPRNKLFVISQLEELKIFLEEQRDLIPAPNSLYETLRLFENLRIDNYGLYDVSTDKYMGSSIRITTEGIILYNLHLNNDKTNKIIQISYMSAYILGILNLCNRFFNLKMNYSRQIEINLKIANINNWKYLYPGEERKLISYQYNDFLPIIRDSNIDHIQKGIGQYEILESIIQELMRGYGCSLQHQLPNLSDFRNFYENDTSDITYY